MPEKKLARDFISMPEKINIQIISPSIVYKFNHKGEKIKGFRKLDESEQDSALFASSQYVQYVDDSIYLEKYVNSFIDELRKLGFGVYVDNSMDTFLQGKQQSYVLNMAQVQLDEYILPYEDSAMSGDSVYYKRFDLNAVDASTWFELNKLNAQSPKKTVLYSSMTASDAFDGAFYAEPFSMEVHYRYTIDSLVVRDVYDLAVYSGRQQADYLFDYFMNNFITLSMKGMQPMGYLRYDRRGNALYFTEDERFEVIK